MSEAHQFRGKQPAAHAEIWGVGACGGGAGRRVHTERAWGAELKAAVVDEPAWLVLQWFWMESPHQKQVLPH